MTITATAARFCGLTAPVPGMAPLRCIKLERGYIDPPHCLYRPVLEDVSRAYDCGRGRLLVIARAKRGYSAVLYSPTGLGYLCGSFPTLRAVKNDWGRSGERFMESFTASAAMFPQYTTGQLAAHVMTAWHWASCLPEDCRVWQRRPECAKILPLPEVTA